MSNSYKKNHMSNKIIKKKVPKKDDNVAYLNWRGKT